METVCKVNTRTMGSHLSNKREICMAADNDGVRAMTSSSAWSERRVQPDTGCWSLIGSLLCLVLIPKGCSDN